MHLIDVTKQKRSVSQVLFGAHAYYLDNNISDAKTSLLRDLIPGSSPNPFLGIVSSTKRIYLFSSISKIGQSGDFGDEMMSLFSLSSLL